MPALTPEQAFQVALAHHRAGHFTEAATACARILTAEPSHAPTLNLLGMITAASGQIETSVNLFQRAIAQRPSESAYHFNLGATYRHLERIDEAVDCFYSALSTGAAPFATHLRLSEALRVSGRLDEAIASYHAMLKLQPDDAITLHDLGYTLARAGRRREAIEYYHRALAKRPVYPDAHVNLGTALLDEGRPGEAETAFRSAVSLRPDDAEAHSNLGVTLLLLECYAEGWEEFEWRWRLRETFSPRGVFSAPRWDGGPAPGQTILCHAEQGLGDTIQFLRYVPVARQRAHPGRMTLEVSPELARLVSGMGDIVVRKSWDAANLPPFDQHIPLLSLPLVLGVAEPLPTDGPYLRGDPELRAAWQARLSGDSFRVGIAWAGSAAHPHDERRSIAHEKLSPLLQVEGVSIYRLQLPPATNEGFIDLTPQITDLADTAALIEELDLVISVDTAVAHLAGALGRPVWTLLPFAPDWRWGLGREDTPWYPSMRLFRQRTAGDWDEVVRRVAEELRALVLAR